MARVTIIQQVLYNYRLDFYKRLKEPLCKNGIELQLVIEENLSHDPVTFLDFFTIQKNRHLRIFKGELIYQPCMHLIGKSDMIFLELSNKLLFNYLMMARGLFVNNKKLAFWGHAQNLQISPCDWRNRFKRLYFKNVDWWFPYTQEGAEVLIKAGFPQDRITIIYNTTDIEKMRQISAGISQKSTRSLMEQLGICGSPIGIFCGRIYKEKRINFLLDTCIRVKKALPDFTMLLIGNEEEDCGLRQRFKDYPWIKYIGAAYGEEKARYFKMADLFLSPGLVGLSITDTFAFEVPMITTNYPYHSPEVEYIINGQNGVITEDNLDAYAKGIINVFRDKEYLERLKKGCQESSKIYTMDNMVSRMVHGIKECLKL